MKDKIMMLVFVLVLGTILTGILVAVNYYTTPVISRNEQREIQAGILQALGIPFAEGEEQQTFAASVQARQAGEKTYYVAEGAGIAFAYAGSGLWGPINGIVALNPDLATLKGVTILHQEETPGLGSRITEAGLPGYLPGQGLHFRAEADASGQGQSRQRDRRHHRRHAQPQGLPEHPQREPARHGARHPRGRKAMKPATKVMLNGLWKDQPIFSMVLGICSSLAVSNKVENAIAMGAGVTFALIGTALLIAALRKLIPGRVRMIAYMIIIATFVIVVDRVLKAMFPDISRAIGPYVGLIITNCILMGRAEAFYVSNGVGLSDPRRHLQRPGLHLHPGPGVRDPGAAGLRHDPGHAGHAGHLQQVGDHGHGPRSLLRGQPVHLDHPYAGQDGSGQARRRDVNAVNLLMIFIATLLTSNIALTYLLGMCPFIALSKRLSTATGMGYAVIFVVTLTAAINWPIYHLVLVPLKAELIYYVVFIITIAAVVQLLEMLMEKFFPALQSSFGIFLPLITVNCIVLAVSLFMILRDYDFVTSRGLLLRLLGRLDPGHRHHGGHQREAGPGGGRAARHEGPGHRHGQRRDHRPGLHGLLRNGGGAMNLMPILVHEPDPPGDHDPADRGRPPAGDLRQVPDLRERGGPEEGVRGAGGQPPAGLPHRRTGWASPPPAAAGAPAATARCGCPAAGGRSCRPRSCS